MAGGPPSSEGEGRTFKSYRAPSFLTQSFMPRVEGRRLEAPVPRRSTLCSAAVFLAGIQTIPVDLKHPNREVVVQPAKAKSI